MLHDAGAVLASTISERRITHKKSELSIVTASDQKCEKLIFKILDRHFPDHAVLSEESPARGISPYRWIIDPLDGTTNFAHTFPVACVSIAFEANGIVEMGGVYDPFRKELFFAERGRGAALNGKKIKVSPTRTLRDSLLCTGFPYDRRKYVDKYLAAFKDFMMKVQGIRRVGAAALDLCNVACGRYDGYWETKLQPWDKAAAGLIVREAGGRVSNFSGAPMTLTGFQNLASNGRIHSEMLAVLRRHRKLGTN